MKFFFETPKILQTASENSPNSLPIVVAGGERARESVEEAMLSKGYSPLKLDDLTLSKLDLTLNFEDRRTVQDRIR